MELQTQKMVHAMASREGSYNDTDIKLPRATRVKNKTPAPIQITAEQLLREARECEEAEIRPPKQKIIDYAELSEHRLLRRKEFEDLIRRVSWNVSVWVRYAHWEESQKDFARARSVWERALKVDYTNRTLWLRYAEMEMKNNFINHARNVWNRAVTLLPRIDQLWYEYIHMEEMLGNFAGAREIFERWMGWEPDHHGWSAYIKFELRLDEVDRARAIYERYVQCLPTVKAWVKFAKFEFKNGAVTRARSCYERAVAQLEEDGQTEEFFVAFAEFEERCKELERARRIYLYALDHIPRGQAEDLYKKFVAFEKRYGDREGIENSIVGKRRFQYEEEIKKNSRNYDVWFDYVRLQESIGNVGNIREVYERAIANVPPAEEKRYWKRYIYLWIWYSLYEELEAEDMERAREVYMKCLKLIPHIKFSFAKIWIMAAQFEIRQKNLKGARLIMDNAIGMIPKDKIFKTYIEIELGLRNIDRCRVLYEKYLEWAPANCYAWNKYAELERSLKETKRWRSIFELAIMQPVLDMPELLWKAYIEFEISEGKHERTRKLYERLLDRTKHFKVWLSYAKFEAGIAMSRTRTHPILSAQGGGRERTHPILSAQEEGKEPYETVMQETLMEEQILQGVIRARGIFERAFESLSAPEHKEERAMLLDGWKEMERSFGVFGDVASVEGKMPRRVKRKRPIMSQDGTSSGYEEYIDYIFPQELGASSTLKILEAAYKWKKQNVDAILFASR